MENEEITIIVSSRKTAEEGQEYIEHIKNTIGCKCKIIFITNKDGAVGLSELYGSMLANKEIKSNRLCFIHDDLEFLKSGWGLEVNKIMDRHKELGILGVAGSAEFGDENTYGGSRWWSYNKRYGQVMHKSEGKSWLTCFSDLLENDYEEVCVIDGLFMAVDRRRIKKNFDKELKWFDAYDLDFSLANYIEGVTIGVTTNIRLAHKSVGKMSEHWAPNVRYVCEKYKDYLPIDMPKPKDKRFKRGIR